MISKCKSAGVTSGHKRLAPCWLSPLFATLLATPLLAQDVTVEVQQQAEQDGAREQEVALELNKQELDKQELNKHQQAIHELQSNLGVYAPQLQEAYGDLAALYEEVEDYESAISIYSNALQISRINTGLYSEQQLPIIKSLIDSNSGLQDWQEIDDLHELSYHISTRIYESSDSSYLQAASYYGDWKLRLLRENLLDQNYHTYARSAEELSAFYERLIANLEAQPDFEAVSLLPAIYNKTETDLVLARAIASTPYTAFEGTVSRYVYQSRCRNVSDSNGQPARKCANVQVENPRYRQSQQDAKQFALIHRTRAVQASIERLRQIHGQSEELGEVERDQLASQINELETQSVMIAQGARYRLLY